MRKPRSFRKNPRGDRSGTSHLRARAVATQVRAFRLSGFDIDDLVGVTGTIAGWIYWLIVMVNSDGYSLLNSIGNIRVIWLVVTGTMEFYDFPYTGNSNPN
jgi:hypothetical protein